MDSEQFSLIFSCGCCCISVISAIVAGAYGLEAYKASRTYKEEQEEKKKSEEYRKLFAQLTRK